MNLSCEEYFDRLTRTAPAVAAFVIRLRSDKDAGRRSRPSTRAVMRGPAPQPRDYRAVMLDKVAELVDENLTGRSDMCKQFAVLTKLALGALGEKARARAGRARYRRAGGSWYEWDHAWVLTEGGILIDGNVDTMRENPAVPEDVDPHPFWGPQNDTPADRHIPPGRRLTYEDERDPDVQMWFADLSAWIAAGMP